MLPNANWQEHILWILGQRHLFQVVEVSMQPTLNPGDKVLSAPIRAKLAVGDIVIAYHPSKPGCKLIKRVQAVFYDGGCYLASDNRQAPNGQDSRSFGVVGQDLLIGRVTSIFYRAL